MILTSHQPNFLPYMGVFYKAYRSDILVLSDDVQFSKKGISLINPFILVYIAIGLFQRNNLPRRNAFALISGDYIQRFPYIR